MTTGTDSDSGRSWSRLFWWSLALGGVLVLSMAAAIEPDPRGYGTHTQLGLPPCGFLPDVRYGRAVPWTAKKKGSTFVRPPLLLPLRYLYHPAKVRCLCQILEELTDCAVGGAIVAGTVKPVHVPVLRFVQGVVVFKPEAPLV